MKGKILKIQFNYDIGKIHIKRIKELQSNVSEKDIITMYEKTMWIPYREPFCSYNIVKEGD
jgi:hypothetical protein